MKNTKHKKNAKASWWELPAWMLPSLLFVGMIFYTCWSAWWI